MKTVGYRSAVFVNLVINLFFSNMIFFTIGVFNSSEEEFFNKLTGNKIDTFLDIRQRRGVRGSKYDFVNSVQLQKKLASLNINYVYFKDLAPTIKIRELQKRADRISGEVNTKRSTLGSVFALEYRKQILEAFNYDQLFSFLRDSGAERVVLFCVEEKAKLVIGHWLPKKLFYFLNRRYLICEYSRRIPLLSVMSFLNSKLL